MGSIWGIRTFSSRSLTQEFIASWLILSLYRKSKYLQSETGQEIQRKLWDETVVEMKKLATLPSEFN
jgi:hypothetical protein